MSNESNMPPDPGPTELDEGRLADITGGKTYTGGRFMLDIAGHSVGYVKRSAQSQGGQPVPPAAPPAR